MDDSAYTSWLAQQQREATLNWMANSTFADLANAYYLQTSMDEKLCRAKAYLSDKALNREKWVVRKIA